MAQRQEFQPGRDALAKVTAEANGIFAKMGAEVEKLAKGETAQLDVLKIAHSAGLELDEGILHELKIDRIIIAHPFIPWHCWYPWRPLWCWWWHRYHPWYRCCPYWWHHCHYHPWHH